MAGQEYVYMEPTARAIASECYERFAPWIVNDELTAQQRRELLMEVLAHVAHDGLLARSGLLQLTTSEERLDGLLTEAYAAGYVHAITDIDEGQGAK